MTSSFLILIAHGSKDPRWKKTFEDLKSSIKNEKVKLCYMEFIKPDLMEIVFECVNEGAEKIKVLPLFMAGGGHVDRDIPTQVSDAKKKYPKLNFEVLKPIGEHEVVVEAFTRVICKEMMN